MKDPRHLSVKEVSAIRGKLKARRRAEALANRAARMQELEELKYQNALARELKKHL